MKIKHQVVKLIAVSLALGLTSCVLLGCKNISPQTQRLIETDAVAGGVVVGLMKYPEARPAIAAATPVVCAAASGTNISSAQLVSDLQAAGIQGLNAPSATLIVNGALAVYSALEDQFGTNSPAMQNYLGGLCDGFTLGLSLSPGQTKAMRANAKREFHIPAHLP